MRKAPAGSSWQPLVLFHAQLVEAVRIALPHSIRIQSDLLSLFSVYLCSCVAQLNLAKLQATIYGIVSLFINNESGKSAYNSERTSNSRVA